MPTLTCAELMFTACKLHGFHVTCRRHRAKNTHILHLTSYVWHQWRHDFLFPSLRRVISLTVLYFRSFCNRSRSFALQLQTVLLFWLSLTFHHKNGYQCGSFESKINLLRTSDILKCVTDKERSDNNKSVFDRSQNSPALSTSAMELLLLPQL